jgi:hypothetical protein
MSNKQFRVLKELDGPDAEQIHGVVDALVVAAKLVKAQPGTWIQRRSPCPSGSADARRPKRARVDRGLGFYCEYLLDR